MILVGIRGKKRAGKDAAAKALVRRFGFEVMKFAQPLYDMAYALDPMVTYTQNLQQVVDARGWEYAKDHVSEVRRILQRLGTEAGREILGENIWVDAARHRLLQGGIDRRKAQLDAGEEMTETRVVFTDVRFPNEQDMIESLGGTIIEIQRPHLIGDDDSHVSEHALDGYPVDATIVNDGTFKDLHDRTIAAVSGLI